jgi:hypothetical protein
MLSCAVSGLDGLDHPVVAVSGLDGLDHPVVAVSGLDGLDHPVVARPPGCGSSIPGT